MERLLYNTINSYFSTLERRGFTPAMDAKKALVFTFFWDFIYGEHAGILKRPEYMLIEKALDCLYGTSCLIPYPDYLKMGKLRLGQMEEIDYRLTNVENTKVVKGKNHVQNIPDIDLTPYDKIDDDYQ